MFYLKTLTNKRLASYKSIRKTVKKNRQKIKIGSLQKNDGE